MKRLSLFLTFICAPALAEQTLQIQNITPITTINSVFKNVGHAPAAPCESCLEQETQLAQESLPGLHADFLTQGAQCDRFIDRDGNYGAYGNTLVETIRAQTAEYDLTRDDLPTMRSPDSACPNRVNLTKEQREHFWVWSFAAIAYAESRCKASARNPNGTNTVAIGLLQLPEPQRSRSWRGGACKVASVQDATNNLKCGMRIMEELMKYPGGLYSGQGRLFVSTGRNVSYWEALRRAGGGGVATKIKLHPLCGHRN